MAIRLAAAAAMIVMTTAAAGAIWGVGAPEQAFRGIGAPGQAFRGIGAPGQANDKVDLTGKWLFNVQTDAGGGTPTFTLKQDGDKLTGKYSGQFGEADVAGTVKGKDFEIKYQADAQGQKIDIVYKGTVETKDTLKGTMSIVGLGEGTFTAKRQ